MVTQVSFGKFQAQSADGRVQRDGNAAAEKTPPPTSETSVPRNAEPDASTPAAPVLDMRALETAVNNIAKTAQNMQRSLQFSVDEVSGRTVITVIDKDTDEVIRRIPSEEVQTLAEHFARGAGALVTTKA